MAGLYMGYGNGRTVYDSLNAEVDSDVWQAGLMGQWRKEALTLRGDVNYAHITNDSARHTPVPEGWAGNYGDYKQQVMGAGLRAGYDVTPWTNGLLTPYLELRYQHLKQDGFSESGGMWAMRLDSVNADSFTSALGVELKHTVYGANGISMTPSLNVAWVHEFGDDSITSQNAFVNAPGWYDVSSVSTDRDRARIDLGLSLGMLEDNRLSLNLGYQAEVGAESFSHTYFGGLQLKF